MLQFPPWKLGLIFLVLVWGVILALPNVVNMSGAPGWMPKKGVNLGLDLQGGVYLMMEIQADEVVANRLDVLSRAGRFLLARGLLRFVLLADGLEHVVERRVAVGLRRVDLLDRRLELG